MKRQGRECNGDWGSACSHRRHKCVHAGEGPASSAQRRVKWATACLSVILQSASRDTNDPWLACLENDLLDHESEVIIWSCGERDWGELSDMDSLMRPDYRWTARLETKSPYVPYGVDGINQSTLTSLFACKDWQSPTNRQTDSCCQSLGRTWATDPRLGVRGKAAFPFIRWPNFECFPFSSQHGCELCDCLLKRPGTEMGRRVSSRQSFSP